jgi:hypothetical protein
MERRFDMTNFEQSLKDQADQFEMVPSRRVWHGIYNDLHPGSKWPSIAMALVFLFTLLGIGHLNNSSRQFSGVINPSENNEPGINTEQSSPASVNSIVKIPKVDSHQNGISQIISVDGDNNVPANYEDLVAAGIQKSQFANPVKTGAKVIPLFANRISTEENTMAYKVGVVEKKLPATSKSSLTIGENVPVNLQQSILTGSDSKEQKVNAENITTNNIGDTKTENADKNLIEVGNNSYPGLAINNEVTENYLPSFATGNLNLATVDHANIMDVKGKQNNLSKEKSMSTHAGNKMAAKSHKKRNEKIRWLYYVTPSITTASFIGKGFQPVINPNASQIILQTGQPSSGMVYKARLGYEVGTQMSYTFLKNLQFLAGVHLSYSGFNVISNQVHPTFATLLLKDESSGLPYAKNYITHYGNGEGQNQISLANYSLQVSIPVGFQYALFDNHKIQIQLASTIEPSLVMKSNSFIISSDQRYYVNDPDLLRKVNLNGNIGSYVTFTSNKVHWQVGPNVRYQLLSTYKNLYPVNEHLIDYGIRIGISR